MKAEEERRKLADRLQAEALLQQMEELKLKEVEVRASAGHCGLLQLLVLKRAFKNCTKTGHVGVRLRSAAALGSPLCGLSILLGCVLGF